MTTVTTITKTTLDLQDDGIALEDESNKSPLPLHVIPNYMGINLCSVRSVGWSKQADGQLLEYTIKFNPAANTTSNPEPVKVVEEEVPPSTLEIPQWEDPITGQEYGRMVIDPELVYAMIPSHNPEMYLLYMRDTDSRVAWYPINAQSVKMILDWPTHRVLGYVDTIDTKNHLVFYRLALTHGDDIKDWDKPIANGYVRYNRGAENTHIVQISKSGEYVLTARHYSSFYVLVDPTDVASRYYANCAFIALCQSHSDTK